MTPPNPRGPRRPSTGKPPGKGQPAGKGKPVGAGKTKRPTSGTTRPSQPTAVPHWPDRPTVDVPTDGVRRTAGPGAGRTDGGPPEHVQNRTCRRNDAQQPKQRIDG